MDENKQHLEDKSIITNCNNKHIEKFLLKYHPDIYQRILNYFTDKRINLYKFPHKLCYFLHDLKTFPKCKICGKECIKEIKYQKSTFNESSLYVCSKPCLYKYRDENTKRMWLEKYGVDNISKLKSIQDKKNATCLKNYGVSNPSKSKEVQDKKVETMIERYGVCSSNQSEIVKNKIRKTNIERYGVDNVMKSQQIVDKLKQTNMDRFGSEWYLGTQECLEKTKQTVNEKYGVDHISQIQQVKDKKQETFKKNYIPKEKAIIIKQPISPQEIQDKRTQTSLEKYGIDNYARTEECKDKIKQTSIQKYGVEHYAKSEEYRQKLHIRHMTKRYELFTKSSFSEPLFTLQYYLDNHENDELSWKCKKCGKEFKDHSRHYFNGVGRCLDCYPMSNNISKSEKELLEIIKSFGINNIIENSKTFIDGYEIDIICPDQKIALEFDGVHWHTSQFIIDSRYHLNKTELCENKGYHLIHIFENEWIEKRDIVVSRLKSIFGIHNNIIYARKCTIKEVSQLETKQFLNINHIQGNVISKKNIGLYYNDELVSIMTFGSYRINLGQTKKENEYELLRFCNKLNYHIPGAASKLLKYFIRHYNPIKIISYADRRWSKGNLYEKLGFKFIHNTQPNYYYNINDHLENRFNWRKTELSNKLKIFDPNLTEKQNMENNGYYQIYDCGSKLYELTL